MFYIIEKTRKNILNFWQGIVKLLYLRSTNLFGINTK